MGQYCTVRTRVSFVRDLGQQCPTASLGCCVTDHFAYDTALLRSEAVRVAIALLEHTVHLSDFCGRFRFGVKGKLSHFAVPTPAVVGCLQQARAA